MKTTHPHTPRRLFGLAAAALLGLSASTGYAGHEIKNEWLSGEHASGDWGGLRTALSDKGVDVTINYTGEVLGNVSGGLKKGAAYNGLLELGLDVDFEKAVGIPGLSMHVNGFLPHGTSFTDHFGGDIGTASNIEFYNSYRLFEAWLQQDLFDGLISIRAGQLALDAEFTGSDYAGLFLNSDFGAPAALSGNMPVPIYAIAAPGVRLRVQATEEIYVMAAIFDGNPAPAFLGDPSKDAVANSDFNHYGTHWALRGSEGALWIAEVGYQFNQPVETPEAPEDGKADKKAVAPERGLAGSYKAGFLYHTDAFVDFRTGNSQQGNYAIYAVIDQELWREPGTDDQGLGFFARGVFTPEDRNPFNYSCEAGFIYNGLLPGRDADTIGVAYAHINISNDFDELSKLEDPTTPGQDYEDVIELTYSAQITPWLSLQPDVQYIMHPGGSSVLSDEWVVGLRTNIAF